MHQLVPKESKNLVKEIVILGVTRYNQGYCIAGMDGDGNWVRPVSNYNRHFWHPEDLFMADRFVETGDVWEVTGQFEHTLSRPNHIEDFRVSSSAPPEFSRKAPQVNLLSFLDKYVSNDIQFNGIVGRQLSSSTDIKGSLCLIKAESFSIMNRPYDGKDKYYVEIEGYNNPHQTWHGGFRFNCIKALGLFEKDIRYEIPSYFAIGLAAPFNGKEHPSVIGIHSSVTELPGDNYPN